MHTHTCVQRTCCAMGLYLLVLQHGNRPNCIRARVQIFHYHLGSLRTSGAPLGSPRGHNRRKKPGEIPGAPGVKNKIIIDWNVRESRGSLGSSQKDAKTWRTPGTPGSPWVKTRIVINPVVRGTQIATFPMGPKQIKDLHIQIVNEHFYLYKHPHATFSLMQNRKVKEQIWQINLIN